MATRPDQRSNLVTMSRLFTHRYCTGKTPLFVICGAPGSGKSLFARALANEGHDARYVDWLVERTHDDTDADRSHLPDCAAERFSTFIIDGAGYADEEAIVPMVEQLLRDGKTVVLLAQMLSDLPLAFIKKASMARMERLELIPDLETQTVSV